jgi:uncharacterized protein YbaR (Trm112 family)
MSAPAQEAPRPAIHKMSETPVVTGMLVASVCAGNVEAYRVEDGTPILTAESLASYTAEGCFRSFPQIQADFSPPQNH